MAVSGFLRASRLVTAGVLAVSLAGCGQDPAPAPRPGPSGGPAGMCAVSQKRNGIEYCTRLFPGPEPVRLPADPSGKRYAAVTRGGKAVHTRGGDLPIAAALQEQLGRGTTSGHAPYANTIYLATVAGGMVTRLEPAAEIDENAVLKAVFAGRAMEGTIGTLAGPGSYTDARTLPIRVEFSADPSGGRLAGKIVNAAGGVRGSTGACIAPLPSRGGPLTGQYTATVGLQRFPAMHGAFDDELLLVWGASVSNMGDGFYPSVATLLGADRLAPQWATVIHGTPVAGPAVTLHLVTGGGGAC